MKCIVCGKECQMPIFEPFCSHRCEKNPKAKRIHRQVPPKMPPWFDEIMKLKDRVERLEAIVEELKKYVYSDFQKDIEKKQAISEG